MFSMSALKKVVHMLVIVVNLMIIYIERTIAKTLDINDIIKKIMEMSAR
jgi:hypothetical protein